MERDDIRILVIGGDAAGMSFASKVKREKPGWQVTVLEKGNHVSYSACGIPYYVGGTVSNLDDLKIISPDQFRQERDIDVRMRWKATHIDRENKRVSAKHQETGQVEEFGYDTLMIATGARAVRPPIEGIEFDGVFKVRDLDDAYAIH